MVIVTILILVDGFLQSEWCLLGANSIIDVTILILVDGFLQLGKWMPWLYLKGVTILILVDGFLQF